MAFSNGQNVCYPSSVTNEPTKVTGRCPLPITCICNKRLTKKVTTTTYRSPEIVFSLGPQGPLVIGIGTEPVTNNTYL
jgi:hypothetical protein